MAPDPAARLAVVTGAGRGIGAAVARRAVADGFAVARLDVSDPARWTAVDGANVTAHRVDVTDEAAVAEALAEVAASHGGIDLVVNSAGVNLRDPAAATATDAWRRVLEVNLTATFVVCRLAHPHLVGRGTSAIVNLSSLAGVKALTGGVAYGVSKAGIGHLTRILALEWAADGIRVNAVAPAIVPTEMSAAIHRDEAALADRLAGIPLGRVIGLDDVTDAVAYLASATSVTGQILALDGGATA